MKRKTGMWLLVAIAWSTSAGCAGPLVVTNAQSSREHVKFGYTQAGTRNQGIIECKQAASGDLQDCRHMRIEFAD